MTKTAVIVIDVQQMFFGGAQPAYRAAEVIDGINRLTAAARRAGAPVFIVQHESDANGPLARGSDGWQLPTALDREASEGFVHKTVGDAFHGTALEQDLREQDVGSVVLCGYASEFCVNATARRAELLGLRTIIASDIHTTADKPHLAAGKIVEHQNFVWLHSSMTGKGVNVRPLNDILQTEFA
ncbi:isochorismatase family protein [Caballeronia peredens]|nr:isochorismatase family protein [Caballeronia peredens]